MGMYTELVLGVELVKDAPTAVSNILIRMTTHATHDDETPELPNHPLFTTPRWSHMLQCDSYYFDGDTASTFRFDDIAKRWTLTVRCNLKNYDDEIDLFLDWLAPFCGTQGFAGYQRYEEADDPTLIYFNSGSVYLVPVVVPDGS